MAQRKKSTGSGTRTGSSSSIGTARGKKAAGSGKAASRSSSVKKTGTGRKSSSKNTGASRKSSSSKKGSAKAGSSREQAAVEKMRQKNRQRERETSSGIALVVMGIAFIFIYLSLAGFGGSVGSVLSMILFGVFGSGAWLLPVWTIVLCFYLMTHRGLRHMPRRLLGGVLLILFIQASFHLHLHRTLTTSLDAPFEAGAVFRLCSAERSGGGIFGGWFAHIMYRALGVPGSILVYAGLLAISLVLILQRTPAGVMRSWREHREEEGIPGFAERREIQRQRRQQEREEEEEARLIRDAERYLKRQDRSAERAQQRREREARAEARAGNKGAKRRRRSDSGSIDLENMLLDGGSGRGKSSGKADRSGVRTDYPAKGSRGRIDTIDRRKDVHEIHVLPADEGGPMTAAAISAAADIDLPVAAGVPDGTTYRRKNAFIDDLPAAGGYDRADGEGADEFNPRSAMDEDSAAASGFGAASDSDAAGIAAATASAAGAGINAASASAAAPGFGASSDSDDAGFTTSSASAAGTGISSASASPSADSTKAAALAGRRDKADPGAGSAAAAPMGRAGTPAAASSGRKTGSAGSGDSSAENGAIASAGRESTLSARTGETGSGAKSGGTAAGSGFSLPSEEDLQGIAVHRETEESKSGIRIPARTAASRKGSSYVPPTFSLLEKGSSGRNDETERELKETAYRLQETLRTFGVQVTITDISQGPSVTRYELKPDKGVKVSRIVNLSDDIKLRLAATDIRIEAPIPGKSAIGIEVPNKKETTVHLRELLESREFRRFEGRLPFAVGKDIGGKTVIADISRMPHLLIAGATGSGKSVCINTIILSILYRTSPEKVRLLMIDPKVVELSVYKKIPHLIIPVVTDARKASAALNWAVAEMEKRYKMFAAAGVRDLNGYNALASSYRNEDGELEREPMHRIVIIVDELADLMMVAKSEVESAICRLAQLARAAGIHLIIATQRPSVDVITGLIKANMPSRIAFAVSSQVDSRTILDMAGAEKLIGRGDMLFYPQNYQKPARIQGAFVSDDEVTAVVDYIKKHNAVEAHDEEIDRQIEDIAVNGVSGTAGGEVKADPGRDEYFAEAGRYIIEKNKASIGLLQRVFKIGFNRAARIMDQLAEAGVVSEESSTRARQVLMSMPEFEAFLENE